MSELIINIALLAVFLVILVRSAMFAIDSIVKFSRRTRISELAAGFVIVAVATSTPEISVAIFSTYSDNVGITLGDIFGSNVTNIALITALFLLVSPVKQISQATLRRFFPLLVAASLIPLLLLLVQQGTVLIGMALLAAFAFFIYRTFKSSAKETKEHEPGSPYKPLLFFFIG
ncbi:MAG TPA: sodium:calcium antiporter, partial [Nitrosopumilaceae archaeon]|nr:sodium:calcium antiporter [Nitrosopumilaceae archaeon]